MSASNSRRKFTLRARDWTLNLGERTLVMGILNATPDSFSDKGRYYAPQEAIDRAWQIAEEGADILDIGGESTRPGSQRISAEEELRRVMPILEALAAGRKYPIPISIDTSKLAVAKASLECGAAIINDITSLQKDPGIGSLAAGQDAALVLMHMRGEPSNMQTIAPSKDILADIDIWAKEAVARAQNSGVSSENIVLDPGIGFGKTAAQNLEILRNLDRLAAAGFPVLVGTSRKSFIGALLKKAAGELVLGTGATVAASIIYGAHIVRVHDVAAIRQVADVTDAIVNA
ncbi:MAG: dihydropteroate synthase [Acidobacteria bacterium]|nr:dihydropteroate synthase [Acidobacteriota bacterium]